MPAKKPKEEAEVEDPSTENVIGISVLGVDYLVDLDAMTADLLRECFDTLGKSEVQIVLDLNSQPGRLYLANFIWLAVRSAGRWITFDDAFALANPEAMRSAKPLTGKKLAQSLAAAREAHPQS